MEYSRDRDRFQRCPHCLLKHSGDGKTGVWLLPCMVYNFMSGPRWVIYAHCNGRDNTVRPIGGSRNPGDKCILLAAFRKLVEEFLQYLAPYNSIPYAEWQRILSGQDNVRRLALMTQFFAPRGSARCLFKGGTAVFCVHIPPGTSRAQINQAIQAYRNDGRQNDPAWCETREVHTLLANNIYHAPVSPQAGSAPHGLPLQTDRNGNVFAQLIDHARRFQWI